MPLDMTIRGARADDAEEAVPLIYSSGASAFDFVFGTDRLDAQGFLRKAFANGGGTFGYRYHTVVELDGRVVAAGTAYSGDRTIPASSAVARQIISAYRLTAPQVIANGLRVESVIRPPKKGIHYIAHLGVVEDVRGRGIGSLLIDHLHEVGRQAGRAIAELDVAVTNFRAQELYERSGYQVVSEESSSLANRFGSVMDHRRMAMAL